MNASRRPPLLLGPVLLGCLAGCSGGDGTSLPEPTRATVTSTTEVTVDPPSSTTGTESAPSSTAAEGVTGNAGASSAGAPMDHNDGPATPRADGTCGEVTTRKGEIYEAFADHPATDCRTALATLQEYLDGMPYTDNGNAQVVAKDGYSCSTPTYVTSHEENVIFRCAGRFGGIRVPLNP